MSLLDTASLIVTPNGYKEGKLYSVIPSDGSGDMSVVRATTATRVNSAGLVELVPYNLLQYSEQLDNAYWSTQDATITANTTTAPNGTLTADTFTRTANTGFLYSTNPLALITGSYAISVYAKANAISSFRLDLGTSGFSQGTTCTFDLSNGTAGTPTVYGSTTSVVASIENVGNGWYRCSLSANFIAGNYYAELAITTTGSIYAWGFQLVEGSTALPYQKTETRLNIPRLDYSNGTCPSLLVEPQRTNLALYSSSFDNADWNKQNASVTANTTTSPDGTQNADSLIENGANDNHLIYQGGTLSAGSYSASVFIKKNTRQYAFLQIATDAAVNRYTIVVDLNNGTMTASSTSGAPSGTSYKIDSIGNGWYRLSVTATHTSAEVYSVFGLSNSGTPTFNSEAIPLYSGDGTSSAYFWGAQIEAGSYPTSYIPTTSASVTRNSDAIFKTGISSLIGQTEGTLFLDFDFTNISGVQVILSIHDSANNKRLEIWANNNILYGFIGGSVNITIGSLTIANGRHRVALGYKQSGDQVFYIDGVQIGASATTYTISALTSMIFGYWSGSVLNPNAEINATALWKTRLTNDELATLTTI